MQIGQDDFFHLTYCTKVHPGCGWEELFGNLRALVPQLKARLAPARPFGLGLRLSNAESLELLAGDQLAGFQEFLARHNLYVFTLNGFPYGTLAGQPVKEGIFAPDWRAARRLDYTLRLVDILARLLPPGLEGGISTVPLSYQPWIAARRRRPGPDHRQPGAPDGKTYRGGRRDRQAHPPGPGAGARRAAGVQRGGGGFFQKWLLPRGAPQLARAAGLGEAEARRRLLRHLRVCLDTCHLAVAFEDPAAALDSLAQNGIQVGKVQITAGLEVMVPATAGRGPLWPGNWSPLPGPPTCTRSSPGRTAAVSGGFRTCGRPWP